jgi:hypothetical protein
LAGNVVHDRPIDQISLDDRRHAAQQDRGRKGQPAGGRHRQEGAQDHDGDLDVEFGTDCFLEPLREAWKEVGDGEADQQSHDVAALVGQFQRPADAELLQIGRRHRGDISEAANDPTRIGQGKDGGKGDGEPPHIQIQRGGSRRQHGQQRRPRFGRFFGWHPRPMRPDRSPGSQNIETQCRDRPEGRG